jgi:hypothetical protein
LEIWLWVSQTIMDKPVRGVIGSARGSEQVVRSPFGLSLTSDNVNEFLLERIRKKLTHWIAVKANPTGRATIVNSVLLGACFFFFSIWGGTKKGIARVKTLMINYLASGGIQRSRAKVGWLQCCQDKSQGGISLVNPEDVVVALMMKWILKAVEPGSSNLHLMLRYRLSRYQPYQGGRWESGLEFFMVAGHQSHQGSLGSGLSSGR